MRQYKESLEINLFLNMHWMTSQILSTFFIYNFQHKICFCLLLYFTAILFELNNCSVMPRKFRIIKQFFASNSSGIPQIESIDNLVILVEMYPMIPILIGTTPGVDFGLSPLTELKINVLLRFTSISWKTSVL